MVSILKNVVLLFIFPRIAYAIEDVVVARKVIPLNVKYKSVPVKQVEPHQESRRVTCKHILMRSPPKEKVDCGTLSR